MSGDDHDGCGNLMQRDPTLHVKCPVPILVTPLGAKHCALHFMEEDAEIQSCPNCRAQWDVNYDEPAAKPMLRWTGRDDLVSLMHATNQNCFISPQDRLGWCEAY